MPKADSVDTSFLPRRRALLGGAALVLPACAATAKAEPLVKLELSFLDVDRRWITLNKAITDADDEDIPVTDGQRAIHVELCQERREALERLALAVPASPEGVAVKLRRLLEAAMVGPTGWEVELAQTALAYLTAATGRPQLTSGLLMLDLEVPA